MLELRIMINAKIVKEPNNIDNNVIFQLDK